MYLCKLKHGQKKQAQSSECWDANSVQKEANGN